EGKKGYNWGLDVFELMIDKETSVLEYHGEFITKISTKDILKILQDYKKALDYFQNNPSHSDD
ncbi:hypothetical protein, partial [Fulvivirga kasyanovii]